jgi:signal transduction histidine kinase
MTKRPTDSPIIERVLAGGGEMGRLMREVDWARTPLGAVESWPQSLRTAVSIMLESRFAMVVAWGPEFIFLYNDRYRPVLGSTKHPRALGRPTREIFPEVWDFIGPLFHQALSGDAVALDDVMISIDRHGYLEECFFTLSYSPIRDERGDVGGLLAVVAETTERVQGERRLRTLRDLAGHTTEAKTAEQALENAAATLARNLADIPFALLYLVDGVDETARLVAHAGVPRGGSCAPETVRLDGGETSWPLGEAKRSGRPIVVGELAQRIGQLPGGAYPEATHTALVLPLTRPGLPHPDGFLVVGVSPRRALDDRYHVFLQLTADQIVAAIGNARAHEQEKKRAEALAEIDRAKTAFFSNVSHEFRTPLTLMLGPTEDALRADGALRGPDLEMVHRNELRLLMLVNALLDFSRIEAGRIQACYEATDLATVTAELASSFRSAIERAGLRFEVDCPSLSQPAYVDRDMWEKIVFNLLSNAFKFTFDGTIRVAVREAGDRFELEVRDTGAGIPSHEVSRVFERFHRIEGTRARTQEGSGIGLALVHDLVKLHGGVVSVDTAEGQGTTFTVSVPVGLAHLPSDKIGTRARTDRTAIDSFVSEALRWLGDEAPSQEDGAARARVLIADDNADMREYLGHLLRPQFALEVVSDGAQALAAARANPPDLVLTDVMMPHLDGFGLLRALRAAEETADIPVIMLSARAGEEARVGGLDAGADDYLVKPFSARELLARVSSQIGLRRARAEIARERAALLERERRAREDAEAASRTKDTFLAMLGHELRNPLSPIVTAVQLMRMRGYQAREIDVIERQVGQLTRMVDDLLDIARITRGKIELRKRPLEVANFVLRGLEMASPLLEQRRQQLDLQVPPEGLVVDGDVDRLAQVVSNLLTNASKYSEPGTTICLTARREGDRAVVSVRDEGVGIPREMLENIFDLFVQEPQALDRAKGGLGLGLTIVRRLVEMHDGTVAAHSDGPGQGSEFVVRLPRLEGDAASAVLSRLGTATARPASNRNRVLIVDDNIDAAHTIRDLLVELGYVVDVAFDGPTALAHAISFRPNVCLLDIGLPVMDGYEVARRLRHLPGVPPDLRIIALTGYGQDSDVRRSEAAGFDGHVVKPVDVQTLTSLVSN